MAKTSLTEIIQVISYFIVLMKSGIYLSLWKAEYIYLYKKQNTIFSLFTVIMLGRINYLDFCNKLNIFK